MSPKHVARYFRIQLVEKRESLQKKYKRYSRNPHKHPKYWRERTIYWQNNTPTKTKIQSDNYQKEWTEHWEKCLQRYFQEEQDKMLEEMAKEYKQSMDSLVAQTPPEPRMSYANTTLNPSIPSRESRNISPRPKKANPRRESSDVESATESDYETLSLNTKRLNNRPINDNESWAQGTEESSLQGTKTQETLDLNIAELTKQFFNEHQMDPSQLNDEQLTFFINHIILSTCDKTKTE